MKIDFQQCLYRDGAAVFLARPELPLAHCVNDSGIHLTSDALVHVNVLRLSIGVHDEVQDHGTGISGHAGGLIIWIDMSTHDRRGHSGAHLKSGFPSVCEAVSLRNLNRAQSMR